MQKSWSKHLFFVSLVSVCLTPYAITAPSTRLCPNPEELVRDNKTLIWSSHKNDWKSYAPSFSRKIEQFMGAQWQGVNVGNLFCIYQGDSKSFLITLQYHTVVQEPSGGQWGANADGLRNCRSHQQSDCPFIPAPINQPIDIDKAIDQIKPLSPEN